MLPELDRTQNNILSKRKMERITVGTCSGYSSRTEDVRFEGRNHTASFSGGILDKIKTIYIAMKAMREAEKNS
jgi:hypothetical protein